jgi:hypothetical protein
VIAVDDLQLNNLLHRADEAASHPAVSPQLATRVQRAARRRTNVRRATGGVAILAITAAGIFWLEHAQSRRPQIVQVPPKVNVQQIRLELVQYEEQANQHMLIVERLLQDEKQARQRKRIERLASQPHVDVAIESQRDQTAQILVDRADRLLQHQGDVEQAQAAYERVIELFPATPAAQTARLRLDNLKAKEAFL